jgi:hypothetical protein
MRFQEFSMNKSQQKALNIKNKVEHIDITSRFDFLENKENIAKAEK